MASRTFILIPWSRVSTWVGFQENDVKCEKSVFHPTELSQKLTLTKSKLSVDNSSDRKWDSSLRDSGQNGIDFRTKCFDHDSLSASCLGGLVLSANKKKLFLVYRKIFQLVDPVQHRCVFSKGPLGEFCQLQLFPAEIYLFFRHWNFKINATSWTHTSCVSSQLAAFAQNFGVREEFFCPAFIRFNLVTALSRFREQCTFTWRPWILKCLEATRNWYHISPIWQVFSPGEEIVNWFDLRWHQN